MQNIRNFAIIAHVDHGKSTLADRLLELTGTIEGRRMHAQILDSNPIERERGITIKLAPVRMEYKGYVFNLIDTPGHVDFSYEVNRSLAACEGAVLLVDATQGVQAQTLAHFNQAKKLGLAIIPVLNKIDVTTADIPGCQQQLQELLHFSPDSILLISAKTGVGIPELVDAVINRIPAPQSVEPQFTRALVFNSNFDSHLGVLAWIRVIDGSVSNRDKVIMLSSGIQTTISEVGVFRPQRTSTNHLTAGEVGYVVTGLKDLSGLSVGDTLAKAEASSFPTPLPGYQPIKPVVFMSFYPTNGEEIHILRDSLDKLKLQDSALEFTPEFSPALGNGFRVGFLGLLHADVVQERLEREFGLALIAAAPSVEYEILKSNNKVVHISKAMDLPDQSEIREIREPIISLTIFTPEQFTGSVMQLCQNHRGTLLQMIYTGKLVNLQYRLPLSELIRQFYDHLKSISQGFATIDYEVIGYEVADLVKLDILIASDRLDALSQIVPRSQVSYIAKNIVETLKNVIPRQQFEIALQAAVGGKIFARTDIKAFRKDVIARLSGGDQTRKDKLLKKQKKGKARMKRVGKIDIPQEAFLSILKVN